MEENKTTEETVVRTYLVSNGPYNWKKVTVEEKRPPKPAAPRMSSSRKIYY